MAANAKGMTVRITRTCGFPQDAVYAWWTDFREDDHEAPNAPARSRRTIVRRSGNEIWLRDAATRPARVTIDEHVTLDPPRGYRVVARYPLADVEYAYAFEGVADGTRIVVDVRVRPRHLGRILVPLTAPWWRRYAERDLEFHLEEMVRDLADPSGRATGRAPDRGPPR